MKYAILLLLAAFGVTRSTVLGDAAASMAPKTWKAVDIGLVDSLYNEFGDMFVYANDAVWDPGTEKLFFMNAYHGQPGVGRIYEAKANLWRKSPVGAWSWHVYDDLTVNDNSGLIYHFNIQHIMRRFSPVTEIWDTLPQYGPHPYLDGYGVFGSALEYFPDMNSLIHVEGASYFERVVSYDLTTNTWTYLAASDTIAMGNYHVLAEYSPAQHVMIFGGGGDVASRPGDDSKALYTLDSTGKTRRMKDAPMSYGIQQAALTVDPVTGTFLFLNDTVLYGYHAETDTWENLGPNPGIPIIYVAVTPISNYGVALFMCGYGCSNHVWLYKYADTPSTAAETAAPGGGRMELTVSPNPVRGRAELGSISSENRPCDRAAVYDLKGRLISRLGGDLTWDASGVPAGIYLVRAVVAGRTLSRRVVVE